MLESSICCGRMVFRLGWCEEGRESPHLVDLLWESLCPVGLLYLVGLCVRGAGSLRSLVWTGDRVRGR
jgi:hypothetical protein